MLPLVEYPEIVKHYARAYRDVFSAEAYIEFQRYISGLIVCENMTVDGIKRLMVLENRNQSSLNRLLTGNPFSLGAVNRARLRMLAEDVTHDRPFSRFQDRSRATSAIRSAIRSAPIRTTRATPPAPCVRTRGLPTPN
jgi:hypothetical protein